MIKNESGLTEPISSSSEAELQRRGGAWPRPWSALAFLVLVVIFMAIFAGEFVNALIEVASPVAQVVPASDSALHGRGGSPLMPFDLPAHRSRNFSYIQHV